MKKESQAIVMAGGYHDVPDRTRKEDIMSNSRRSDHTFNRLAFK